MFRRILPLLAACALLTGCSTVSDHTGDPTPTAAPAVTDAPTAQPVPSEAPALTAPDWGEQVYLTSFTDPSQPKPIFEPEYRLPLIKNAEGIPAYEAVNAFYAAALDDLTASSAEIFAFALEDAQTAEGQGLDFRPYVDTETYELTLETAARVSILRSHYSNSGAAHPLWYPIGDTFDLTTGERLDFADLFSVPAEEAEERVRTLVFQANADGAYEGNVLPEELLAPAWSAQRFYLTEDSMVFYFPDSELPHAVGTPTFAVPYTELEDILLSWD